MREFGKCQSCSAEIEWAWLNGRAHPFDMDPTKDGSHELIERPGDTRTLALYRGISGEGRLVKSHFATCPDAGKWRRSEKRHASRHSYSKEADLK